MKARQSACPGRVRHWKPAVDPLNGWRAIEIEERLGVAAAPAVALCANNPIAWLSMLMRNSVDRRPGLLVLFADDRIGKPIEVVAAKAEVTVHVLPAEGSAPGPHYLPRARTWAPRRAVDARACHKSHDGSATCDRSVGVATPKVRDEGSTNEFMAARALAASSSRGDPQSALRLTCKSLRALRRCQRADHHR